MFGLVRQWRRRRILRDRSLPDELWAGTVAAVPSLARLNPERLTRLRDLSLLFVEEKQFTAAGGLELDSAMRLRIAALASRVVLELGFDWYDDVHSVVVYPDEFVVPELGFDWGDDVHSVVVYPDEFVVRNREVEDEAGIVHVGDDVLSGEAWDQGPVVLAWSDVAESGLGHGYDVVAHEFAHKLDLLSGAVDGMPPLHAGMRASHWAEVFQAAYDALGAALERGEDTWIDPYAAEEPAEFFAVCAELFFDVPGELAVRYPSLYAELAAFFKQDPVERAAPRDEARSAGSKP